MIEKERVGKMLKDLRLARGWLQGDVAEKVGLSRASISNIELGRRALTLDTLKRFCEVYNVDISFFGIETESFDETKDLQARIEAIFNDPDVSNEKKDELYREIMKIYLKNR